MTLNQSSSSNKLHQILLSPQLTAFVIVDHQLAFESCFDVKAVISAENSVANLVNAAEKIDIPIIASLVEINRITSKLSARLEKTISQLTQFNRSGVGTRLF